MSELRHRPDGELQEYLDGRLSAEQRAAFEARLTREPALRAQLEGALEIRDALSSEPEALSPGFYTRARARFEESSGRTPARWTFRLLSWETAGVAAAAALATALFVPWLTDTGVPRDLGSVAPEAKKQAPVQVEAEFDDDRDAREPPDLAQLSGHASEEEAGARSGVVAKQKSEAPRPADLSPLPVTGENSHESNRDAGRGRFEQQPSEPQAEAAGEPFNLANAEVDALESRSRESLAAPLSPPPPPARKPAPAKRADRIAFDESVVTETAASAGRRQIRVELAAGLVEPGGLRTIEDPSTWQALLDGPQGAALAVLGPPTPDRRLVLIGTHDSVGCDTLRLIRDRDAYRIEIGDVRVGRSAGAGCAVTLPRDGLPVVVVGPADTADAP